MKGVWIDAYPTSRDEVHTKGKVLWAGLFGRVFFCSSSHPYAIPLKRGEKSPHSVWDQNLNWVDWSARGQNLRELVRNVLMPQMLIIGVLFKPSHYSVGILFPLCLRGMTLLGCQILEILESDKCQTKPLTSHFCKFLLCISQDSPYSKAACIGLYHSPTEVFSSLLTGSRTMARKSL